MKNSKICESCEFYDYDENYGSYVCQMRLDVDEMEDFLYGRTGNCSYYRLHDEYGTVRKQI